MVDAILAEQPDVSPFPATSSSSSPPANSPLIQPPPTSATPQPKRRRSRAPVPTVVEWLDAHTDSEPESWPCDSMPPPPTQDQSDRWTSKWNRFDRWVRRQLAHYRAYKRYPYHIAVVQQLYSDSHRHQWFACRWLPHPELTKPDRQPDHCLSRFPTRRALPSHFSFGFSFSSLQIRTNCSLHRTQVNISSQLSITWLGSCRHSSSDALNCAHNSRITPSTMRR